jgi:RNA polymerase sigma-70 factor (ECF subfamily)
MVAPGHLSSPFLAELGERARAAFAALPDLEERLRHALELAHTTWPGVEVALPRFLAHLASRCDIDPATQPVELPDNVADLYLACGCVDRDPAAIRSFEDRCIASVDGVLRRMRCEPNDIAEIKQALRERLLFGRDGTRPKIADYRGTGDLGAWVRAAATREALTRHRRPRRDQALDDEALLPATDDPEIQHLKVVYRAEFKEAFEEALGNLKPKDRTLLRQWALDGVSVERLAVLHGLHRTTASRWLGRVRRSLLSATRRGLERRLQLTRTELDSIMRLIRSQIDVSLQRVLGGDADGA